MRFAVTLALHLLCWLPTATVTAAASEAGRTVVHAMGETLVPARPGRVVTLSYESTESALVLGLNPVGAVAAGADGTFFPHHAPHLVGTAAVGTEDSPDLAAIAALKPDLILGLKMRHAALHPRLSAIAPTVFCETLRGEWQANLTLWGRALGREEAAASLLAGWRRRVAEAQERLGPERSRIAVVRFLPNMARLYHQRSFAVSILNELGFVQSEFRAGNSHFEELPAARLGELRSCRAIFWFTWEEGFGDATRREQEMLRLAEWRGLPAVQAGRAWRVDDAIWNTGGGLLSAQLMLNQLVEILGSKARAEQNH